MREIMGFHTSILRHIRFALTIEITKFNEYSNMCII